MRRIGEIAAASTAAAVVFALTFARPQAHKPITSKYTYNDDVFPIVSERCGGCHGPNGAAPMSLLTYQETVPWAESIREELVAERMPPWFVDPRGPSVRAARAITAREIDTIVTWATGGTPEGDAARRPVPKTRAADWLGGRPNLVLPLDSYSMAPQIQDEERDFTVATGIRDTRW